MLTCITFDDFEQALCGPQADYYRGRWEYYREVIAIVQSLPIRNVLEIGPGYLPIVTEEDVLLNPEEDAFGMPASHRGKHIVHDATIKPWPIGDKQYDLAIALQVWEHLDNKQPRAFRELMRICKRAILSFPFQWEVGEPELPRNPQRDIDRRLHRDIDRELIADWTLRMPIAKEVIVGRTGPEYSKGPRFIGYWEFD